MHVYPLLFSNNSRGGLESARSVLPRRAKTTDSRASVTGAETYYFFLFLKAEARTKPCMVRLTKGVLGRRVKPGPRFIIVELAERRIGDRFQRRGSEMGRASCILTRPGGGVPASNTNLELGERTNCFLI